MYTGYTFTLCDRKQYKLEIIDEVRGKNYVKQKALAVKNSIWIKLSNKIPYITF